MLSSSHKSAPLFWRMAFALLLLPSSLWADRKYFVGASVDVIGSFGNQTGEGSLSLARLDEKSHPSYSIFPTISLSSVGERSTLDLGYTFSGEYYQLDDKITSFAHAATTSFTVRLGSRARLELYNTLSTLPDISTVNVVKGIIISPEGFQYIFEPEISRSTNISESGNVGLSVDLGPKSSLAFGFFGAYRDYGDDFSRSLSSQARLQGRFGFLRKHSTRTAWGLDYTVWQNNYDSEEYSTARSHSLVFGYKRVLNPGLDLSLSAGPAYVESDSYVSHVIDVQISKKLQNNSISAGYSHRPGDSTGLGGTTESHQGRLGFSRSLGRTTSINLQMSAFNQAGRLTSRSDFWGARGAVVLSRQLGRHWVMGIGGSYMTYVGRENLDSEYKRAYVSIGYRLPDLWRTLR